MMQAHDIVSFLFTIIYRKQADIVDRRIGDDGWLHKSQIQRRHWALWLDLTKIRLSWLHEDSQNSAVLLGSSIITRLLLKSLASNLRLNGLSSHSDGSSVTSKPLSGGSVLLATPPFLPSSGLRATPSPSFISVAGFVPPVNIHNSSMASLLCRQSWRFSSCVTTSRNHIPCY